MEGRHPDRSSGFVLTGGRSTRMGRDKALLPVDGQSLLERTAEKVRAAAGSVTLIGAPERYVHLDLPAVADMVEDCGPLGGLYTALKITTAEWNLLVACDMPGLTAALLASLLRAARQCQSACLVPQTASGLHPLCAVYHRSALASVESAINHKCFKMHDLLKVIGAISWPVSDASLLDNANTPADWDAAWSAR
jgi:molybdopterin-guanine dinucleotide biosynthesis protein A